MYPSYVCYLGDTLGRVVEGAARAGVRGAWAELKELYPIPNGPMVHCII